MARWVEGYLHVATREFTQHELDELRRMLRKQRLLCILGWPAVVFFLCISLGASVASVSKVVSVSVTICSLILTLVICMHTVRAQRVSPSLKRDLQLRQIDFYSDPAAEESNMEAGRAIELLGATGMLWSVSSKRVAPFQYMQDSITAARPPVAEIAEQWLERRSIGDDVFELNVRELSMDELRELSGRITKESRYCLGTFIVALWMGINAQAELLEHHDRFGGWLLCAISLAFLILSVFRLRLASRLSRDLNRGEAIILRNETSEPSQIAEVLPLSRLYWTVNGNPAWWRRRS